MTILRHLPCSSFVPFRTRRFRSAKVVYANLPLFHAHNMLLNEAQWSSSAEQAIINDFAYAAPTPGYESPEAFLSEEKTFFAERYGGWGILTHGGGARAALIGNVQIKGAGPNPLLGATADFSHSNGFLTMEEAIRETVYSELAHAALPHGGSRVLAVIALGTPAWHFSAQENRLMRVPRALVVRESKARPANFLRAIYFKPSDGLIPDAERVRRALQSLPDLLPTDGTDADASPAEQLRHRISLFAKRSARQHAASKAKRLMHGAISPSNILLDGGWVDFGTASAVPGFSQYTIADKQPAFWDDTFAVRATIDQLLSSVQRYGSNDFPSIAADRDALIEYFDVEFQQNLCREFVCLLGFTRELLDLLDETQWRPLGSILQKLARSEDPIVRRVQGNFPPRASELEFLRCVRPLLTAALQGKPQPEEGWPWTVEGLRNPAWSALNKLISAARHSSAAKQLNEIDQIEAMRARFDLAMADRPELDRFALTRATFAALYRDGDRPEKVQHAAHEYIHTGLRTVLRYFPSH